MCCCSAPLVSGIYVTFFFFVKIFFLASSMSLHMLVFHTTELQIFQWSADTSSCFFLPCPTKLNTVLQPVRACNIGSDSALFYPNLVGCQILEMFTSSKCCPEFIFWTKRLYHIYSQHYNISIQLSVSEFCYDHLHRLHEAAYGYWPFHGCMVRVGI